MTGVIEEDNNPQRLSTSTSTNYLMQHFQNIYRAYLLSIWRSVLALLHIDYDQCSQHCTLITIYLTGLLLSKIPPSVLSMIAFFKMQCWFPYCIFLLFFFDLIYSYLVIICSVTSIVVHSNLLSSIQTCPKLSAPSSSYENPQTVLNWRQQKPCLIPWLNDSGIFLFSETFF